jgi:hypothetical protein
VKSDFHGFFGLLFVIWGWNMKEIDFVVGEFEENSGKLMEI